MMEMMFTYSGKERVRDTSRNKTKARRKEKLNWLLDKRETKKMKGLAEAGEQRGEGKDFKAREKKYREKKGEVGD